MAYRLLEIELQSYLIDFKVFYSAYHTGSPLFLWQMYTDFEVKQDSLKSEESLQSTQSTLKKNKNSIFIGIPSTTPSCDGSGSLFGQREKISKPVNSLGKRMGVLVVPLSFLYRFPLGVNPDIPPGGKSRQCHKMETLPDGDFRTSLETFLSDLSSQSALHLCSIS